jgi:hypothetical protein
MGRNKLRCYSVRGIRCWVQSERARKVFRDVLDRIRVAQESDYQRIQRVVREIVPLTRAQKHDGTTLGEWKEDLPNEDPATWDYGLVETPGVLWIASNLPPAELFPAFAHELGHACVVYEDRKARGQCPCDEWQEEATADWYAVKRWGFQKEMERLLASRDWVHHGPWAGQTAEINYMRYRLTKDFVFEMVGPASGS